MTQGKRKPTKAAPRNSSKGRATGDKGRATGDGKVQSARAGSSPEKRAAAKTEQARQPAQAKRKATRPARATQNVAAKRIVKAKDAAVEAVNDTASEIGNRARRAARATLGFLSANALPLTLLGLGTGLVTYTVLSRRRHNEAVRNAVLRGEPLPTETGAQELLTKGREKLAELAERAAEGAHQVGERVQQSASRLSERAAELGHDAVDGLVNAEQHARDFAKEHPLATTAAAVATGVGIGMAIPTGQLESKVLRPVGAKIANEAKAAFDEVKSGVHSALEAAAEVKNNLVARASR